MDSEKNFKQQKVIEYVKSQADVARVLKTERKKRGYTQDYLAGMYRMNRRTIIDLEKADTAPSFETIRKIASGLGYEIAFVPKEARYYCSKYKPLESENENELVDEEINFMPDL